MNKYIRNISKGINNVVNDSVDQLNTMERHKRKKQIAEIAKTREVDHSEKRHLMTVLDLKSEDEVEQIMRFATSERQTQTESTSFSFTVSRSFQKITKVFAQEKKCQTTESSFSKASVTIVVSPAEERDNRMLQEEKQDQTSEEEDISVVDDDSNDDNVSRVSQLDGEVSKSRIGSDLNISLFAGEDMNHAGLHRLLRTRQVSLKARKRFVTK